MSTFIFPSRAFLQGHYARDESSLRLSPESQLVADELRSRYVPVVVLTTEDFQRQLSQISSTDLVVGDFNWTKMAFKQLSIPQPDPPDYPACLSHLLHRKIWMSTLGGVAALLHASPEQQVFIKPASDTKAFSGLTASLDWMTYLLESFPASVPVLCSDLIVMVSEYRVYVVDGTIRSVCHYQGPKDVTLDMPVVEAAVQSLCASEEGRQLAGCSLDFAVIKKVGEDGHDAFVTGLVEVNDGYSLGAYEGISAKDYTDMLIARWGQLVKR